MWRGSYDSTVRSVRSRVTGTGFAVVSGTASQRDTMPSTWRYRPTLAVVGEPVRVGRVGGFGWSDERGGRVVGSSSLLVGVCASAIGVRAPLPSGRRPFDGSTLCCCCSLVEQAGADSEQVQLGAHRGLPVERGSVGACQRVRAQAVGQLQGTHRYGRQRRGAARFLPRSVGRPRRAPTAPLLVTVCSSLSSSDSSPTR